VERLVRHRAIALVLAAIAGMVGCDQPTRELVAGSRDGLIARESREPADPVARARRDSINRARPGYIVDSIIPIAEALRRFRADIPEAPSSLEGGAGSRDALVAMFATAVGRADTAALARLAITRAEFAYLVYPSSPHSAGPLRQAPELVWMRMRSAHTRGLGRMLDRYAGRPLELAGYRCPAAAELQGENALWSGCVVLIAGAAGDTVERRLFGSIIEREGRFKFAGFANGL
jgi:hypothetical protein